MGFIISITIIISVVADVCWTETEKGNEASRETLKLNKGVVEQESSDMSTPQLNALWINKPLLRLQAPRMVSRVIDKSKLFRPPYAMTKLAKSLTTTFDPYFRKEHFEPFERRPKPITLVTFRKSGIFSRLPLQHTAEASSAMAELQSPHNDISNFWSNSPYD